MDERSLTRDSSYMVWIRSDAFPHIMVELAVGEIPLRTISK